MNWNLNSGYLAPGPTPLNTRLYCLSHTKKVFCFFFKRNKSFKLIMVSSCIPRHIQTLKIQMLFKNICANAAAAAAKSLQSCPTLCDPIDGSPPGSLSLGFSRQEHWSGLPFPSPMHESEK